MRLLVDRRGQCADLRPAGREAAAARRQWLEEAQKGLADFKSN